MNNLKKSIEKAPLIKKGKYQYVIHELTDGIPAINPNLLNEVTDRMYELIKNYRSIDKIVTIEAMGIPLATLLSIKLNIPFAIIRKRKYGLDNEFVVEQETGYSKSRLYLNGFNKGENIVLVDDVLSTGGTLISVLNAFNKIGVNVKCVVILFDKGNSIEKIKRNSNIEIFTIVKIHVKDGKTIIRDI
jgi:adenine phosphoribosyltransferase